MNRFSLLVLFNLIALGLLFAWTFSHGSERTQIAAVDTEAAKKSDEQYQRQLNEQATRANRVEALLTAQEETHRRYTAVFASQEELLKKQQAATGRYEKVLDIWERQQQQYQKYLDDLSKK